LSDGAVHLTTADPPAAVATVAVGAAGLVLAIAGLEVTLLSPSALRAVTLYLYVVPFCKPVIVVAVVGAATVVTRVWLGSLKIW
jgi:hypothetical protein